MARHRKRLGFFCVFLLSTASACASAVKNAAKEAAPTAVHASVKEVHEPTTRDRVADVLADPNIQSSMTELSQSVADGVLDSLTEKQRVDQAMAAGDAFLEHMNRSLAKSFEHDLSPAIAALIAASVERTLEQAKTQGPLLKDAIGVAAREAGRQAALGFQDAVVESDRRRQRGEARPGEVLASVGRASDAVMRSTWIVVAAVAVALVLAAAGGVHVARRSPASRAHAERGSAAAHGHLGGRESVEGARINRAG